MTWYRAGLSGLSLNYAKTSYGQLQEKPMIDILIAWYSLAFGIEEYQ